MDVFDLDAKVEVPAYAGGTPRMGTAPCQPGISLRPEEPPEEPCQPGISLRPEEPPEEPCQPGISLRPEEPQEG
jgi:hypothetical protein